MSQPILGAVTLPYPTNWRISPVIGEVAATTLSGRTRSDILYRKYKYILSYDALSKNEYETLLAAINTSLDAGSTPLFSYDKIGEAVTPVAVIPSLSDAERVFGAGNEYRIRITLELLEVTSR